MREIRRSVCPHDCPSQSALVVHVDDGRVTHVGGDPAHPITRGVVATLTDNTLAGLAVIEGIRTSTTSPWTAGPCRRPSSARR